MKRIFRYISYTLMYLIISIASAYGVILLSSNNSGTNDSSNASMPPQISNMINSIMQTSNLDLDLALNLQADGTNAEINISAILDMSQGFESLALQGQIVGKINDQDLLINIIYKNSTVYVEAFNNKFLLETSNLMASIEDILSMIDFQMPSLGFDLSSLDLNTIGGMLSNLKETKDDDKITLAIDVPVVGQIEIQTDYSYRPLALTLPQTQINAINFSVNAEINYPETYDVVEVQEEDYINLTSILDIAKAGINILNQDTITLNSNLKIYEQELNFDLTIDLKNYNVLLTTALNNRIASLIYKDNSIFLSYENLFVKFDLNEFENLTLLLEKYFNIQLPTELINNILSSIANKEILQIINYIQMPEINLKTIDLSVIEKIISENGNYTIFLKEIGKFGLVINNDTLESIAFENDLITASLKCENAIQIPEINKDKYVELSLLLPTVDNILNIAQSNSINGNFGISYNDFKVNGSYQISLNQNDFVVLVNLEILNEKINLTLVNNTIYLQSGAINLKVSLNNIDQILEFLKTYFDLSFDTSSMQNAIETVLEQLSTETYSQFITSISQNGNALLIELANGLDVNIVTSQKYLNIRANYQEFELLASLNSSEEDIEKPVINEVDFISEQDIISITTNILDYINGNSYNAKIDLQYQDLTATGFVSYQNTLEAKLNLKYGEFAYDVAIITDEDFNFDLYISNNNIALKLNLATIEDLAQTITDFLGIDLKEEIKNILNDLKNTTTDFDLSSLSLSIIKQFTKDKIEINYNDVIATINIKNNFVDNFTLNYNDISANLFVLNEKVDITPIEADYQDLATLSDKVNAILNTLLNKTGNISLSLDYVDNNVLTNYQAQARYDLNSTDALKATITQNTENGFKINAGVFDNYVYFDYSDLRVKMEYSSILEIANKILPMVGIEQSIEEIIETIDIGKLLGNLASTAQIPSVDINQVLVMINYIEKFTCNENQLSVILNSKMFGIKNGNNVGITVNFNDNKISNVLINNLYTSDDTSSYLNLNVDFLTFNGVERFEDMTNFMDLTPLKNVILSTLNMTTLTDFEIQGSANISILGINMNVPYTIQLSLNEESGPLLFAEIGTIPVYDILNEDDGDKYQFGDTDGGYDRVLQIYYKQGYIYLYRKEKISKVTIWDKYRDYEKSIKLSLESFMANPLYYLVDWGFGMKSSIMDEIYSAVEKSQNRPTPINFGNVLLGVNEDNVNKVYGLTLNLKELAYNDMMDKMTLSLGLINNAETNYQDYIGLINFTMNMPFTDSIVMNLSTTDTKLVNIGQEIDMSKVHAFADNYSYPEGESWQASDGNWSKQ